MPNSGSLTADDLTELVKERDNGSQDTINNQHGGVKGIAKILKTDPKKGLTTQEATDAGRLQNYGKNEMPKPKPRSYFSFLLDALKDKTLLILIVASIVSIILGVFLPPPGESRSTGWIEGTAILLAVAIVSLVTSINDFSKDRKFRQLSEEAENRMTKVIRDGKQQEINIHDLVVGDLVSMETGDYIPADMLFISGQGVQSDESPMTGEPESVNKGEEDIFLLGGCTITSGSGKALTIAVGTHSQWGVIKASLEKPETKTPLQTKLEKLAETIGKFGLVAAIITLVALILEYCIKHYVIAKEAWNWNDLGIFVQFLITAITIIVVAVPEGLPLAVTLSLAYSMVQMMKDQNLVRHLAACETMGGATNICSDKTGTLTQNKMSVVKFWLSSKLFDKIPEKKDEMDQSLLKLFAESICTNSTAYLEEGEDGKPKVIGTKTEGALLTILKKYEINYDDVRNANEVVQLYPFSSKKKRMSTLITSKGEDKDDSKYTGEGTRLHVKGASEAVLEICSNVMNEKGEKKKLTDTIKSQLGEVIEGWASKGFRTLTIAYKDLPKDTKAEKETEENMGPMDNDLTLIAIVAIEDPIREEVVDAVKQCQHAGITVRMVTGDNLLTAKNIATQCGIFSDGGIAMEGPKFRQLSDQQLDEIIPKLQVVARCSPEDKLILVKRLRKHGEVVACTGDGSNDAPILREADVGFAMGISGTEVAKDACDIVLMDDNFTSIKKAVLWGRNVFDSIRKFIQFQLTVNIVAVITAFVGAVTTGDSPLKAVQMLWVNLIMDTLAALALATNKPTNDLLDRPPYGRNAKLITPRMWRQIIGQAVFQLIVLFFILYFGELIPFIGIPKGESELRITIIFNTFVFCQVFNEFNCRKLNNEFNVFTGIFQNFVFLAVFIFTVVVQFLMVQFGGAFASTEPLSFYQWIFCVGVGVLSLPIGMLLRLIPAKAESYSKNVTEVDEENEVDIKGQADTKKEKELDSRDKGKASKGEREPLINKAKTVDINGDGGQKVDRDPSVFVSIGELSPVAMKKNDPNVRKSAITGSERMRHWKVVRDAVVSQSPMVHALRRSRGGVPF